LKANNSSDSQEIPSILWKFNDMIYLLTAIGLSPGGSTHLHTNTT
jgi:hypothetical protein